jgi:mannose-6-phosphate isomerase-like protein (cupin superfamily)
MSATDSRDPVAAPEVFRVDGAELLAEGNTMQTLARAQNLWLHLKVYCASGENDFHRHPREDHAFLVLQGLVRFEFETGEPLVLTQHQGVMLPRGTMYRFSTGDDSAVLLRIGGGASDPPATGAPAFPAALADRDVPEPVDVDAGRRARARRAPTKLASPTDPTSPETHP